MTHVNSTAGETSGCTADTHAGPDPPTLSLVRATPADIERMREWAAAEDENAVDPSEFGGGAATVAHFAGYLDGQHVSGLSVVRYNPGFAFCTGLHVDRHTRRRGVGSATWEAALGHVGKWTLAADVPPEVLEPARKAGFVEGFRIIRFSGPLAPSRQVDPYVLPLDAKTQRKQIAEIDAACFPVVRPGFAAAFASAAQHHTVVYADTGGQVRGYGVLRPGRTMARIGPLYADASYQAAAIFDVLCDRARETGAVAVGMDVPENSTAGRVIADSRGLSHLGEAYRVYRAGPTALRPVDFDRLCAVTRLGSG